MNTRETQISLVKILKEHPNSSEAKKELYESLYRYMYGVALRISGNRFIVNDLVNEAFISVLNNAVPKYDLNSGANFLTYATFWIQNAIRSYILDNITPIRLPRNVSALFFRKISGSDEDFSKQKSFIKKALDFSFMSTETKIFDDIKIEDILVGNQDFIENLYNEDLLKTLLDKSLLSSKEKDILFETSGYRNDLTHKDKGEYFGVSRQRIQQIRKQSIYKLRNTLKNLKRKENIALKGNT